MSVLMPLLVVAVVDPASDGTAAATVAALLTYPIALAAAGALYVLWRLQPTVPVAWLVLVVTACGVDGLGSTLLITIDPERHDGHGPALLGLDLAVALAAVVVARLVDRLPPPADPALVGFSIGASLLALRSLLLQAFPESAMTVASVVTLAAFLALLTALVARAVVRVRCHRPGARQRIAFSLVLLSCSHVATTTAGTVGGVADGALERALSTAGTAGPLGLAGALLLGSTAAGLLGEALRGRRRELGALLHRIEDAEATHRVTRATLHEVGSTVAGIASATRLVREHPVLPSLRRVELEGMIRAEVDRLERLISDQRDLDTRPVALDEVLRQIVVSHVARGDVVTWIPSGLSVEACPDDLAEIVNVLLENASRHGGGHSVLTAHRRGDRVEIVLADAGPGVPDDQRTRIFEWGARGGHSHGQGIGLPVARRLAARQGGSLTLAETACPGAVFVLRLRCAALSTAGHVRSDHVA